VYTGRWLCQRWYLQHKPFQFTAYSFVVLFGIVILWPLFSKYVLHVKGDIVEYAVGIVPFFVIAMVSGIFIKATRASIQKQVQDANATAEKNKTELKLLQSQLSPHFLFNTLNNMYGISIAQHERIPALLLKLSELLRYSVYETKQTLVPLQEEVRYINNYIDFEKIRIGGKLSLQTSIEAITDPAIKIAPMMLIAFIENAFKHSKNSLEQKIYIVITLALRGDTIFFSVKNSFYYPGQESNKFDTGRGIGLANVKKRLELLYHLEYDLRQYENDGMYNVELQLKIKH
jgi:LytS/YehU family sensor histidine kinase